MVQKNNKRANSQSAVSPKEAEPYISRRFLAGFYGLESKKLLFAVSEISYGDADVRIMPVIAICGSDMFIDLNSGDCKKSANAAGFKQDIYPAIVDYDAKENKFVFKSSTMATTAITAEDLQNIYGKSVVSRSIVI